MQELMDNINTELSTNILNKALQEQVTDIPSTTGLMIDVSVSISINSDNTHRKLLVSHVLLDTGCTRV